MSPGPPLSGDAWPPGLFPFQAAGAARLASDDAVLLADEMGLGKTVQAIAALRHLAAAGSLGSALIVVPAGLIPQWREQLRRWAPEIRFSTIRGAAVDRAWQWRTPADVYLVSYETLRSDFSTNPHSPVSREWGLVVLDEASRIKNTDGYSAHVCKALRRRRAWALTGTPLENSVDDLVSVLEFVQPLTHESAPRTFAVGKELAARLSAVQLRRRKAEVLPELPPKLTVRVPLDLAPRQRQSYDRAEREGIVKLKDLGPDVTVETILELILRLKQICNVCPTSGQSAKLQDLSERLAEIQANGHRALVFSQFVQEPFGLRALERRLAAFRPLVYGGDTPPESRDRIVRRFKEDDRSTALLVSLRAGGQGLNLQEASYVFHFDRWWNPAVEHQAEDRAHRLGQERRVTVYSYVSVGTIEERIEEVLLEKAALFEEWIDGVRPSPGLSRDELLGLFGLGAPLAGDHQP